MGRGWAALIPQWQSPARGTALRLPGNPITKLVSHRPAEPAERSLRSPSCGQLCPWRGHHLPTAPDVARRPKLNCSTKGALKSIPMVGRGSSHPSAISALWHWLRWGPPGALGPPLGHVCPIQSISASPWRRPAACSTKLLANKCSLLLASLRPPR